MLELNQVCLLMGSNSGSNSGSNLSSSSKENSSEQFDKLKMIIRALIVIDYKCQDLLVAGRRDDYQNVLMTRSGRRFVLHFRRCHCCPDLSPSVLASSS